LATVLFTDIVDSTKQAAEMGDRKWGELLQQHHVIVRRELARFRGREVNTAGDYFLIAWTRPGHPLWDEHLSAGTLVGHRHRVETLVP
jgi:class 3 adenylate cyclase